MRSGSGGSTSGVNSQGVISPCFARASSSVASRGPLNVITRQRGRLAPFMSVDLLKHWPTMSAADRWASLFRRDSRDGSQGCRRFALIIRSCPYITICYTRPMNMVEHLRTSEGLSQAEFAEEFGVSQPAISLYESGRRSPNLDTFIEAAANYGQRVVLVPASVEPSHDRSERFGRLLHLRVAEHLLRDPRRVRSIARENLERFPDSAPEPYVKEWRRLLDEEQETELLTVLSVPDRNNTGLLSSSPFAGVIPDTERHELLDRSRSG